MTSRGRDPRCQDCDRHGFVFHNSNPAPLSRRLRRPRLSLRAQSQVLRGTKRCQDLVPLNPRIASRFPVRLPALSALSLSRLRIGPKLTVLFLLAGLLPLAVVGILAYNSAANALHVEAEHKLEAVDELKKAEVQA